MQTADWDEDNRFRRYGVGKFRGKKQNWAEPNE
jgi:hypothetical protein